MIDLDDFLPYRLNVLARRVSRELEKRYQAQFGIAIPEWRVMATLGREQPLSSNDIVERSHMDKAKVSRAVTALVGMGYVAREVHPGDQRLLRLSFTPAGRTLYDKITVVAQEWQRQWLEGLAPEELSTFKALADRLESQLDTMDGNSVR
ncbi:MarR family winged helix-turn-helix transcriptional regulator [Niveispirillum irakense]|uniref:MarR family winged helix-turn-helix transcriptional regulator n=1 Tax=Niveispirillum irakense TaxID=34011 RepID=UPI0004275743|nr:MarR family transcriptional regulator [Niveispirillum irakense]